MLPYKPAKHDEIEVSFLQDGERQVRKATVVIAQDDGCFAVSNGRGFNRRFEPADLDGGAYRFTLLNRPAAATQEVVADISRVMFAMRRALVGRRQVIEVGDFKFRFQRRNEQFQDGDNAFQALQSGVFAYFRGTAGGVEVPGRWVHLGTTDDLEDLMKPYLHNMTARDLEELHVTMAANAALQSLVEDRAAARRSRSSSSPVASNPLLFTPAAQAPGEFVVDQYRGTTPGARRTPR